MCDFDAKSIIYGFARKSNMANSTHLGFRKNLNNSLRRDLHKIATHHFLQNPKIRVSFLFAPHLGSRFLHYSI